MSFTVVIPARLASTRLPNKPLADLGGKPMVLIANTIKGKGVSFMEDVVKWHHGVPTDSEYVAAIKELDEACAAAERGAA